MILRLGLVTVLLATLSACAGYGAARIVSIPQGAEVVNLDDDTIVGVTPVSVWWKESSSKPKFVNIRLRKAGYRTKVTAFWVNLRHSSREDALADPQQVKVKLDKTGTR
jgi:hypothetical protein